MVNRVKGFAYVNSAEADNGDTLQIFFPNLRSFLINVMAISYDLRTEQMMHEKCDMQLSFRFTLEPWYNDPLNNKIPAIKNIISSPLVVISIEKNPPITKFLL
jgi:hypothetical protein